jgi:hypothetical protein
MCALWACGKRKETIQGGCTLPLREGEEKDIDVYFPVILWLSHDTGWVLLMILDYSMIYVYYVFNVSCNMHIMFNVSWHSILCVFYNS